jgi:hypothetical protein
MKSAIFTAASGAALAALCAAAMPTAATAGQVFDVTNVTVQSQTQLDVNGHDYIASAIGLTIQGDPKTLWVYCVDINHVIQLGAQNPALPYAYMPVTTDSSGATSGTGNSLGAGISGEIERLADIGDGLANAATPNTDEITAIQGAIWQIEYGGSVTATPGEDPIINTEIAQYVAYAEAHPAAGPAMGFYPLGPNGQGFGYSQGFTTGVPEPAAWTMMLVGFGALGGALRRRRGLAAA